MLDSTKLPAGATRKGDKVHNSSGQLIEVYEGKWWPVLDGGRSGWWRYHQHYNRDGYCDDPARGY